ncbi:hypothetical protein [Nocardioides yefusunii]|uniref:DUF1707 domain-containing protein n=1 Tax=Nocardioides yefusunii TaxID=2500546 RepID=A0ABW1R1V7_9ACTN|nr:hypothetical protein [Nocardioides yefusunii]
MHQSDLRYLKRVTGALRWRHVEDEQIVLVLRDLRRDLRRTGFSAQDQFGDVADFVSGVPKGSKWPLGQLIGFGLAALLLVGWVVTVWFLRGDVLSLKQAAVLTVPVVLGAVALVGLGRLFDMRLPQGWRRTNSRS